jgi:beta-lactamase regulating signal transducer with metallopeptidase domain
MDPTLFNLGSGVILAWIALPVLAWATMRAGRVDAASHCRALVVALTLAATLIALPFLRAIIDSAAAGLPPGIERVIVAARSSFIPTPFGGASPLAIVGAAWLALVALASTRAALRAVFLRRLAARASTAPAALERRLALLATDVGVAPPRLLVSAETSIPFAFGVAEPTIVLPSRIVDTFEPKSIDLILVHELVHVERGDLVTSAFVGLVRLLFTLHPTARRLVDEICLTREIAVDARVAALDPDAYPKVLLDVAQGASLCDRRFAAVSMYRSDLARRIAALGDESPARPVSAGPVVALAAAIAASAMLAPRLSYHEDCPLAAHRAALEAIHGTLGSAHVSPQHAKPCPNQRAARPTQKRVFTL